MKSKSIASNVDIVTQNNGDLDEFLQFETLCNDTERGEVHNKYQEKENQSFISIVT